MEHKERGNAYHNEKKYDLAIEEYTKAIMLEPNNPGLFGLRGYAYKDRGIAEKNKEDFDFAITDFTESIELYPTASAHCALGILYGYKGDSDRSFAEYENAIRLNPNHSETYLHRGIAYGGKGDLVKAMIDWETVLRIDPNNYAAKAFLDKAREVTSNEISRKQSMEEWKLKYLKEDFEKAKSYGENTVASNYEAISKYDGIIHECRMSGDYFEMNDIYFLLVGAYIERGDRFAILKRYDDAISDWEEVLKIADEKDFYNKLMAQKCIDIVRQQRGY